MPELGDIKSGKEWNSGARRIWVICPICDKGRWVMLFTTKRVTFTGRCHRCNVSFRGGYRIRTGRYETHGKTGGYVYILLQSDDFFYAMANVDGYVHEHRLVMAKHLGRCLHSWEVVHHRNHVRNDNRIENLELLSDIGHRQLTRLEMEITRLRKQNQQLMHELSALRRQGKCPN